METLQTSMEVMEKRMGAIESRSTALGFQVEGERRRALIMRG